MALVMITTAAVVPRFSTHHAAVKKQHREREAAASCGEITDGVVNRAAAFVLSRCVCRYPD